MYNVSFAQSTELVWILDFKQILLLLLTCILLIFRVNLERRTASGLLDIWLEREDMSSVLYEI